MVQFLINSKHGKFEVLVDDDDWGRVSQLNWSITCSKHAPTYFRAETRFKDKLIRLHRFILKITDSKIHIDHINRNPLDNRKENLRICTPIQNMRNIKRYNNKTGFLGVYKNNQGKGKYRACISINDKTYHIPGNYETAKEATIARDHFALKFSGEFAILNFPKKGEANVP